MTTLTWDRHRGHATGYDVVDLGFNYRIDEIRAALGVSQLARNSRVQPRASRGLGRPLPPTPRRAQGVQPPFEVTPG